MNPALQLRGGKLLLNRCGGDKLVAFTPSLNDTEDEEPCCCPQKICWAGLYRGVLFSDEPDDLSVNNESDLSLCKAVVDYFASRCPSFAPYTYFDPGKIAEFVQTGGLYITNCEWTNCELSGTTLSVCDKDGAAFGAHMSAIGASLSRGRGTISTNKLYTSLGSKLFAGCSISGDATAEIVGGTALLTAAPGVHCSFRPSGEPGGVCCGGSEVGLGAVVGFGDSNVRISGEIRNNILKNRGGAAELF